MKTYFPPSLHLVLPPHNQSASDLSELRCVPFALSFFSSTLRQSFRNLYQWHVKLHKQQAVLSFAPEFIFLQTFTYLFKPHPLTAAIVLYSSLKIESFSLWPFFHSYVHFLFPSCIVDWGLMIMMMLIITMAAMTMV